MPSKRIRSDVQNTDGVIKFSVDSYIDVDIPGESDCDCQVHEPNICDKNPKNTEQL